MGVIHKVTSDGPLYQWDSVDVYEYNSNSATKQVLIGRADGASNFEVRYFTIPPGGKSSLDHHAHDHGVLVMHGKARVMIDDSYDEVNPGDVVYIKSWERHQFENLTEEPFTFLCIIPPKPVQPDAQTQPAADSAAAAI